MTENLYLDLTLSLACRQYNLDEHDWVLQTFTDGAKSITVGLEHRMNGAKLRCSFPREEIRFEEMKNWSEEKKLAYLTGMLKDGHTLPPQLVDSFQHAMLKLELPTEEPNVEDSIIVEDETAQEFEAKVGKKVFKRKAV